MKQSRHPFRSEPSSSRSSFRPAFQASFLRSRQHLKRAGRILGPALFAMSLATAAHAQGTMDFSGATTLMGTFRTFAIYAGAVICFGGLIFAGIRMMSGRFQFTSPSRELGVANRDLATIQKIAEGQITAKVDGREQTVTFAAERMRHFDHGYAVTSHSSQGITAERVLVNMDTRAHPELINTRFAYVSVSRASHDAQIYTNDAGALGQRLSHDASKSSALDFRQHTSSKPRQEKHMENDTKQGLGLQTSGGETTKERIYTPAENERHYAPLNRELHAEDARQFGWVAEAGTIQSYQHASTHRHIHIDGPSGQFYDQQKNPIAQHAALNVAMGSGNHHAPEVVRTQANLERVDEPGNGFAL